MKDEPFKYHNDLKSAYHNIPAQLPDEFFSTRVMANLGQAGDEAYGLGSLADRFLAPAFISLGVSLASCVYLVVLTSKMLDSVEVFAVMGLFSGNFGM